MNPVISSEPMPPELASVLAGGILVFTLIVLAISLIPLIFYLPSLQKAFSRIAPERRELTPGLVWLMFIPLFNIVWHFIIVAKLSNSLKNEFEARGKGAVGQDYAWTIGLVMCILICTAWIPFLGILTGIGAFVLWIIYWVKVAGFSAQLADKA